MFGELDGSKQADLLESVVNLMATEVELSHHQLEVESGWCRADLTEVPSTFLWMLRRSTLKSLVVRFSFTSDYLSSTAMRSVM